MNSITARKLQQRAINAIWTRTTWLSWMQVAQRAGSAALLQDRRVFVLERDGEMWFPVYAFDEDGQPHGAMRTVLCILQSHSPWRLAAWFESTSSLLGGHRPRELIAEDPPSVIAAAHDHARGAIHG